MNTVHSRTQLQSLSRITIGRTPLRALIEGFIVAGMALAVERSAQFWLYPLAVVVIASRQHALLVLMHDFAHFRGTRTRWLNTMLGELIGWPFLMSMRGYRRHHQLHHVERHLNSDRDPDFARMTREGWHFPMSRSTLAFSLLEDLLGLNTADFFREARDAKNNALHSRADVAWLVARVVFFLALIAILTITGSWRLWAMYWLVPTLTALKAILRIRAMVDHFGLADRTQVDPTRTVLAPWWERLLFAPGNIGVHHMHHAFGSIPYYRLKEAHEILWQNPVYRSRVRVSKSYIRALLDECCPARAS